MRERSSSPGFFMRADGVRFEGRVHAERDGMAEEAGLKVTWSDESPRPAPIAPPVARPSPAAEAGAAAASLLTTFAIVTLATTCVACSGFIALAIGLAAIGIGTMLFTSRKRATPGEIAALEQPSGDPTALVEATFAMRGFEPRIARGAISLIDDAIVFVGSQASCLVELADVGLRISHPVSNHLGFVEVAYPNGDRAEFEFLKTDSEDVERITKLLTATRAAKNRIVLAQRTSTATPDRVE